MSAIMMNWNLERKIVELDRWKASRLLTGETVPLASKRSFERSNFYWFSWWEKELQKPRWNRGDVKRSLCSPKIGLPKINHTLIVESVEDWLSDQHLAERKEYAELSCEFKGNGQN